MPHDRNRVAQRDERDSTALAEAALEATTDDQRGEILAILHARGAETEFHLAGSLCQSSDPARRILGAEILGQLGWDDRTFLSESVSILQLLLSDHDPAVISAAAVALGHRGDPSAIPSLIPLHNHPDPAVRFGVAFGLGGHQDDRAVATLIKLSSDSDRDTRNWATFALGTQIEKTSANICDALFLRTKDLDSEVRGEALVGLARRNVPEALGLVINELRTDKVGPLALEAAALLARPELYEELRSLSARLSESDHDYLSSYLQDAIENCKPPSASD